MTAALLLAVSLAAAQPPVCGSTAPVADALAGYGRSWSLADWPHADGTVIFDPLTSYFVCTALAQDKPDACSELDKVDRKPSADPSLRDKTLAQTCRMEFEEDRMVRSFIEGASDGPALCEITLRELRGKPLFKPGRLGPACADLARNWDKPKPACDHMKKEFAVSPKDAGMDPCEPEIGVMIGDPAACAAGDFPDRVRHCLDFAAFRAARAARDPEACGRSGICRALMRQKAGACAAYADKVASAFCASRTGLDDLIAKARSLPADQWRPAAPFLQALESVYRCRAASAKDASACADIDGVAGDLGADCRKDFKDDAMFSRVVAGDPGARPFCEDHKEVHFGADAARACGLIMKGWREPEALVKELAPLFKDYHTNAERTDWLRRFRLRTGVETACTGAGPGDERRTCREMAAFRAARTQGGAEACGDRPLCRALLGGGPDACAPYALDARRAWEERASRR